MKVLLDTSVFMSVFSGDSHAEKAKHLLKRCVTAHEAFISPMVLHELMWVFQKIGYHPEKARERLAFLFSLPIGLLKDSTGIFYVCTDLMSKYRLKYGDAYIAASALQNKIGHIISFDEDFDCVKGLKRLEDLD